MDVPKFGSLPWTPEPSHRHDYFGHAAVVTREFLTQHLERICHVQEKDPRSHRLQHASGQHVRAHVHHVTGSDVRANGHAEGSHEGENEEEEQHVDGPGCGHG